ncbi:MAG: hypothetical protein NC433_02935 [Clostridiales bacterium]|nr:hypothetical protein [Clostridiales bacterium]
MRFLFGIAVLFIALALCNKYSPNDAVVLRKIIKIIAIVMCVFISIFVLIVLIAVLAPMYLRYRYMQG